MAGPLFQKEEVNGGGEWVSLTEYFFFCARHCSGEAGPQEDGLIGQGRHQQPQEHPRAEQ